jgi:CHAT domain-containing protein
MFLAAPIPPASRRVLGLAERDPRRAARAAARAEARASERPWAKFALGWALLLWERLDQARAVLGEARAQFAAAADPLGLIYSDYGALLLDQRQLARPQIELAFAQLAARCERVGDDATAALVRLDQARQLNLLGRAREAEALLDQIELPLAAQGALLAARLWRVRGVAAYIQGDYPRAEAEIARAERLFAEERYGLEVARCWAERANVALYQERLDEASDLFMRAERRFARADLPLQRALSLTGHTLVSIRQGIYDRALGEAQEALALFRSLGRSADVGACTLNLGNIYYYTARWEAALGAYLRAEELFAAAAMPARQMLARRNRALVYRRQGRGEAALALLAEVEPFAAALGLRAELAEIWSAQGAALADMGQHAAAADRYSLSHQRFAEIGNAAAAAECRLELGWLALNGGAVSLAQEHFAAAAPALARHPHHAWRARYGLGRCAELCDDAEAALRHYAAASATVATLRHRLTSEEASSNLFALAAQLYQDTLRLTQARGDLALTLAQAEAQRALTLQHLVAARPPSPSPSPHEQAEHDQLRRRISALLDARDPAALDDALRDYGSLILRARHAARRAPAADGPPQLDLGAVRQALGASFGDRWTVLVYLPAGPSLQVVWLTDSDLSAQMVAFDQPLQHLVAQASQPAYRRYIYQDLPYFQGLTGERWERLRSLGERLLPPAVRARLGPDHRLLIVPSGPLHGLPWAALRCEAGWLAERAVIHLLPSLAIAPLLARRSPPQGAALLLGCDDFGGRAPSLPAVADELRIVAARWPGPSEQRLGGAATREALLAVGAGRGGAPALLHIASHAQLLAARGLAAHVKLSDGDLLLPEIVAMRLGGARVVLSTCDGAAADVHPGEEVLSLSWAFLAAGASGVLASLWPVADRAAHPVMAALYETLGATGDLALALALAQRALLADTSADSCPPEVWGSFLVTGACGRAR